MSRNQTGVLVEDAALAVRVAECLRLVGEDVVVLESGVPVPDNICRLVATPASLRQLSNPPPAIQLGGPPAEITSKIVARLDLPLRLHSLLEALHASYRLRADSGWTQTDQDAAQRLPELIGTSNAVRQMRSRVLQIADKDTPVLLVGEKGAGQLQVANALHRASTRASGPFVPLDCASVAPEAIESELFGHERGAFAGALTSKAGRIELAAGGTLFLDAVGTLPLVLQSKLIRAINERIVERLGATQSVRVDVRFVAAADTDLEACVSRGEFREDLYRALSVYPVEVAPLRERRDDIPVLVARATANVERRHQVTLRYQSAALAALTGYEWPQNVHQLEHLIERLALAHPNEVIGLEHLPPKLRQVAAPLRRVEPADGANGQPAPGLIDPDRLPLLPVNGIDLRDYLTRLERSLIQQALNDTHHVVARAADRLHIRRTTLVEKMRKYGISRAETEFASADMLADPPRNTAHSNGGAAA